MEVAKGKIRPFVVELLITALTAAVVFAVVRRMVLNSVTAAAFTAGITPVAALLIRGIFDTFIL